MLDKEWRTVHRCGTLVLGVFLEKDKLLTLSPVITHYDTNIQLRGVHSHTVSLEKICEWKEGEKIKCADAARKVKICK